MKINDILKPFLNELEGIFFFEYGNTYIPVEIDRSYWCEENDGTIVYKINEINLDELYND